jgi:hypothetical protein
VSVSADEIRVLLTADSTQLQEGMAEASAATTSAVQAQMAAFTDLDSLLKGHTATMAELATQGEAVATLQQAGLASTEQLEEAYAALEAAETRLNVATVATADTQAAVNDAFTVTGGSARELGVMIGELLRGNYTRLEGSTVTLANRTGILSSALQFMLSPAGLVAEALAGIAVAALSASNDINKLRAAVIGTGGASGYTVDQLREMEDALQKNGASAGQARDAVTGVASSGKLLGDSFEAAASAAVNMSNITGQSVDESVKVISRLADDPVHALKELNQQFHFLTPAQAQAIATLQQSGQTTEATAQSVQLLNAALIQYNEKLAQAGGGTASFWATAKRGASDLAGDFKNLFNGPDLQQQLDNVNDSIETFANKYKTAFAQDSSNTLHFNATGVSAGDIEQINGLLQIRQNLEQQITSQQQAQQQASKQEVDTTDQVNKILSAAGGATKGLEDQLKQQEADQQVSYDKRLGFELNYWQQAYETSEAGSAQQATAWQKLQELQKQLDQQELETWKQTQQQRTEAARKSVQDVIQQYELQRSEEQAGSQARIATDAQLMARLEQLEGQNTAQFRAALNQRLEDTKEFVAQQEELAKKEAENEVSSQALAVNGAEKAANDKRRANDAAWKAGTESAQQYLATEKEIDQELLNAYAQYLSAKVALDPGNVQALNADAKKWQDESDAVNNEMTKASQQAAEKTQQVWNQAANQITRSMVQGFDQMIFKSGSTNETMAQQAKQAAGRIIESLVNEVLEHFIGAEVKKLAAYIQTQLGITTSTASTTATTIATDKTKSAQLIADAAGVAGAQGTASFAAAPWPIDMGAPAFGASMAASAAGFGSIASAAGGWDNVPADQIAQIHKNEMILPAHIADFVRQGAAGMQPHGAPAAGNAGITQHLHFSAVDGKSLTRMLTSNPDAVTKAARRAIGRGGRR